MLLFLVLDYTPVSRLFLIIKEKVTFRKKYDEFSFSPRLKCKLVFLISILI